MSLRGPRFPVAWNIHVLRVPHVDIPRNSHEWIFHAIYTSGYSKQLTCAAYNLHLWILYMCVYGAAI